MDKPTLDEAVSALVMAASAILAECDGARQCASCNAFTGAEEPHTEHCAVAALRTALVAMPEASTAPAERRP